MNEIAGINNRYFTIFLLQIFNLLAKGDPILGSTYYGVFSFMTILLLVYINSRMISKSNKIIVSLLSVVLLLTYTSFVADLGVVLADYTVTMMILIGILIFLVYKNHQKNYLLLLFGAILFLAFKSKETGVLLGLLIPGFALDSGMEVTTVKKIKKVGLILLGVLIGILIFITLNSLFFHDPFFGFRQTDVRNYTNMFKYNVMQGQIPTINYLEYICTTCVFFTSMASVVLSNPQSINKTKWLWLLAIGIIIFFGFSLTHGELDTVYPRYLAPAIAVLAILSPQFISEATVFTSPWKKINGSITVPFALLIGTFLTFLAYLVAKVAFHWTFEYLVRETMVPFISCLIIIWVVFQKRNHESMLIFAVLIGSIAIPIAFHNLYQIGVNYGQEDARFSPFVPFKDAVNCDADLIFVSNSLHLENDLFAREVGSSAWMFNLYFGCHKTEANFEYEIEQSNIPYDLLTNDYDYVFLSGSDMMFLNNQLTVSEDIFSKYHVSSNQNGTSYLLTLEKYNNE